MSWTRVTVPDAVDAPAAYGRILEASRHRRISNVWQSLGLDPAGLEAAYAHYGALMPDPLAPTDPALLTPAQSELVALVVSATNGCAYCVAHHGPRLTAALGDEALARAVALDYRVANLSAQDRVLLDYAVALTCEPSERKLEDVDRMREYGFGDAAIVRATEVAAFYGYINRVVSGLGVELEPGLEPWEFGAQK
jgi:uncharacterized peroxidase-related enzyme